MSWTIIGGSAGAGGGDDPTLRQDIDWMLDTDTFEAPSIAYVTISAEINSTGSSQVYIIGGTEPVVSYAVSGSLPPEFTFDTTTGLISWVTSAAVSSGTFDVIATNPAGSGTFTVEWAIEAGRGAAQFFNDENLFPLCYVSTSKSVNTQIMLKQSFYGRTAGTSNGAIVEDSAYPIYAANNGNGTWNYMIFPTGYSYWIFYSNSSTDPATLTDGLDSDLKVSLGYDLVTPITQDAIYDSVRYPSDRTDVHYGTALNHVDFGNDATLNNFMTDAGSWSYGFRLQREWKKDGLGRVMFSREGRNWHGVAIGHNATYSEMLYGNGSNTSYDSSEVVTIPANGFPIGAYVRMTYDGSTLSFYVNGVKYYDHAVNSYMDGSSANTLPLAFGNGVASNTYQSITSYSHGLWQGLIDRLWISNGVVESTDDDGTTYPAGVTHSWELSETDGKGFAPSNGSVSGVGVKGG